MTIDKGNKIRLGVLLILLFFSLGYYIFPVYTIDLSFIPFLAHEKGRPHLEALIEKAEKGGAVAQRQLGYKYRNGIGVPQDNDKAFEWHKKAAEQGDIIAQNNLGTYYEEGIGAPKDEQKAIYWYTKAADQGSLLAQMNLARFFYNNKKYEDAFTWVLKAAQQGNVRAQSNLCYMYGDGLGVEQNIEQAILWCKKAADKGNKTAFYNLGNKYRTGEGVKQDYKKAFELYKEAAERGRPEAQHSLAHFYAEGKGITQNFKQAGFWYRKAADNGLEMSQKYLADINAYCMKETLITQDKADGCIIAAAAGFSEAQGKLVKIYSEDEGVPIDLIESYAWFYVYTREDPELLKILKLDDKLPVLLEGLSAEEQKLAREKAREYAFKYRVQE